jgi:hypothetical protein
MENVGFPHQCRRLAAHTAALFLRVIQTHRIPCSITSSFTRRTQPHCIRRSIRHSVINPTTRLCRRVNLCGYREMHCEGSRREWAATGSGRVMNITWDSAAAVPFLEWKRNFPYLHRCSYAQPGLPARSDECADPTDAILLPSNRDG